MMLLHERNLAICTPLPIKNVNEMLVMQIENGNKCLKNIDVKTLLESLR